MSFLIDNVAIFFYFGGSLSNMEFIIDETDVENDLYSDGSGNESTLSDNFLQMMKKQWQKTMKVSIGVLIIGKDFISLRIKLKTL